MRGSQQVLSTAMESDPEQSQAAQLPYVPKCVGDLIRSAGPSAASFWEDLRQAHAVPDGRAYHTWEHIRAFSRHFQTVAEGPGWNQPVEAFMAMAFHDAVYVPGAKDNESRSADLARATLQRVFNADAGGGHALKEDVEQPGAKPFSSAATSVVDVDMVCRLIDLTALHGQPMPEPLSEDEVHFVDADMAILGEPWETYQEYEVNVEKEYCTVMFRPVFLLGRLKFLRTLGESKEPIYLSTFFKDSHEARARENIARVTRNGPILGFLSRWLVGPDGYNVDK